MGKAKSQTRVMTPEILLKGFVQYGSDDAFREVVHSTLDTTFSAAWRMTGGVSVLAEQVCEKVYSELARAARDWPSSQLISPWLHKRAANLAPGILKAADRTSLRQHPHLVIENLVECTPERVSLVLWVLDGAIQRLEASERDLLILRYLERRGMSRDILKSDEGPLRTQVLQAAEHLTGLLRRKKIAITSSALEFILETQMRLSAPAGLERRVSQGALFAAAAKPHFFEMFRPKWLKPAHLRVAAGCAIALLLLRLHPAFHRRTDYLLDNGNIIKTTLVSNHPAGSQESASGYVPVPELAPKPEADPD